jgi:hypothetical protein
MDSSEVFLNLQNVHFDDNDMNAEEQVQRTEICKKTKKELGQCVEQSTKVECENNIHRRPCPPTAWESFPPGKHLLPQQRLEHSHRQRKTAEAGLNEGREVTKVIGSRRTSTQKNSSFTEKSSGILG